MDLQNITGKNCATQQLETKYNLIPTSNCKLDMILYLGMDMDMELHPFTTALQHQFHFTEILPPCLHY